MDLPGSNSEISIFSSIIYTLVYPLYILPSLTYVCRSYWLVYRLKRRES